MKQGRAPAHPARWPSSFTPLTALRIQHLADRTTFGSRRRGPAATSSPPLRRRHRRVAAAAATSPPSPRRRRRRVAITANADAACPARYRTLPPLPPHAAARRCMPSHTLHLGYISHECHRIPCIPWVPARMLPHAARTPPHTATHRYIPSPVDPPLPTSLPRSCLLVLTPDLGPAQGVRCNQTQAKKRNRNRKLPESYPKVLPVPAMLP